MFSPELSNNVVGDFFADWPKHFLVNFPARRCLRILSVEYDKDKVDKYCFIDKSCINFIQTAFNNILFINSVLFSTSHLITTLLNEAREATSVKRKVGSLDFITKFAVSGPTSSSAQGAGT